MWRPWTRAEVEELVANETAQLSELEQQKLRRIRERATLIPWKRCANFGDDRPDTYSTWVLARSGTDLLFFDSLEWEFGIGRLTCCGQLAVDGSFGEKLAWALQHFPPTE